MKNAAEAKTQKDSVKDEPSILQFLTENFGKLELLLLADPKEPPLVHRLAGTRKTRTVYIAESLQGLMNEYCKATGASIADLCEAALIRYFVANGYEQQVNSILIEGDKTVRPEAQQKHDAH